MENVLIQIIMVVIGSIGIAIYFNIEKSKITSIAIGGLISWIIYLVCFEATNNIFTSSLIAAIIVSIYSEIMARMLKSPANIFLIPSIIPLLPGGSFYYTMSAAINMDLPLFKLKGFETFLSVLGITMGTVVGFFIFVQIFRNLKKN
ncbi:threonine/serine exporter family protein [Romboutsia sp.]|uniref:threonine/serine exporter family protein n=1 Tax=Romboutsia sp. TaxID=1965302 RepID=UPI003F3CD8B0